MTAARQYCLHEEGSDDLPVQVPPGRDLIARSLTTLCVFATGGRFGTWPAYWIFRAISPTRRYDGAVVLSCSLSPFFVIALVFVASLAFGMRKIVCWIE
jgi:hypothetical protein